MKYKKEVDKILEKYLPKDKIICVDVGAKGGVFQLNNLNKHCVYYGFEPNLVEYKKLKQTNSQYYFPFGLSQTGGKKQFHITKHASYSSLLKCNFTNYKKHFGKVKGYLNWYKGMEILKTLLVETKTLDQVILEQNIKTIDFLKLDTQGTELSLLRGAKQAIASKKISVIYAEVTFIEVYKNQNLFSDLDQYLKAQDYEFIDCRFYPDDVPCNMHISCEYEKSRFSVGGDAIYVPKLASIRTNKLQCFKVGVILSSLGYLSMSSIYLKNCGLLETDLKKINCFMYKKSFKVFLKGFLPPFLLSIMKKIINKNKL